MRTLLVTGTGGAGTTTVAKASAVHAARAGVKTLLLSVPSGSAAQVQPGAAEAFGAGSDDAPVEVETGLAALRLDAQQATERAWARLQGVFGPVFAAARIAPLEPEEMTVLPGAGEVLGLLAISEQVRQGAWDLVVVDAGPLASALATLALPDTLDGYARRLWPLESRVERAARAADRPAGQDDPAAGAVATALVEALTRQLGEVRDLLGDADATTVRLVVTPERSAAGQARRAFSALALHGLHVDAVVANRVFERSGDPWREAWAEQQQDVLRALRDDLAPRPLLQLPYLAAAPTGLDAYAELGRVLYGDDLPHLVGAAPQAAVAVSRLGDGFALRVPLPLVARDEVGLTRRGDELAVTAGGHRRLLRLPSVLRRCVTTGAELAGGELVITFEPDPDLWMRT